MITCASRLRYGRSEKGEPLCQFVSVVPRAFLVCCGRVADMAETGGKQNRGYADLMRLAAAGEWCCQTGLNCRPLHYQWSALPLSYGSMPGYGNRPKRPLQAGRSLPQGPRSRKRADGPLDDENGPNRRGKREAACLGIDWGRFGSRFRRQIRAAMSLEPEVSYRRQAENSKIPCAVRGIGQGPGRDRQLRHPQAEHNMFGQ